MAEPLKDNEIKESLKSLNGWKHENDKLKKEYSFDDFREAMTFITRISFEAEDQVHHPEIFNVYNTVNIALTSHDAGDKVTKKDVKLAKTIETISNNFAS
jgi:4a-hydroxytetrahydrobiopterin dehydratase